MDNATIELTLSEAEAVSKRLKRGHHGLELESKEDRCAPDFGRLPDEIWETIFNHLDDSRDVQNVLSLLPHLQEVFRTTKTTLLFDQVFPHIFGQMCGRNNKSSVLSCRAVSRRWCRVIDRFLQNHPSFRPYNLDAQTRRTVPYGEFSYRDLEEFEWTSLVMDTPEKIRQTLEKLKGQRRNPIITRVVKFLQKEPKHYGQGGEPRVEDDPQMFMDSVIAFLKELGHYIWDFTLQLFAVTNLGRAIQEQISQKTLACISHIPNVRVLRLTVDIEDEDASKADKNSDLQTSEHLKFPALHHLETLGIMGASSIGNAKLVSFFRSLNGCIKRLEISSDVWKPHYKNYFPSISQLLIDTTMTRRSVVVPRILRNRGFQSVRKLQIMPPIVGNKPLALIRLFEHISSWQVEELEILNSRETLRVVWPVHSSIEISMVPSIKRLRIWDASELGFEFLRALPSLEHLRVVGCNYYLMGDDFANPENGNTLTEQVRSYINHMDSSVVPGNVNIWRELPRLKMLTVGDMFECGQMNVFVREYGNKPFETLDIISPQDE